jgi:hypothetical protein
MKVSMCILASRDTVEVETPTPMWPHIPIVNGPTLFPIRGTSQRVLPQLSMRLPHKWNEMWRHAPSLLLIGVSYHALRVILYFLEEHGALFMELFALITNFYSTLFPHPTVLWLVMLLQKIFWAPLGRLGFPYDFVLLRSTLVPF